jgi:hypothetical protein
MPEHDFPYPSAEMSTASGSMLAKCVRRLSIPMICILVFTCCPAAWGYMSCWSFDQLRILEDSSIKGRITEIVGEKNVSDIRRFGISSFYVTQPPKATCKACFYYLIRLIEGAPQTVFAFEGTGNFLFIEPGGPIPELSDQYDHIAIETFDSYLTTFFPFHGGPVAIRISSKDDVRSLPRCNRAPEK